MELTLFLFAIRNFLFVSFSFAALNRLIFAYKQTRFNFINLAILNKKNKTKLAYACVKID